MRLLYIKKQKGRRYRSEEIIEGLTHEDGGRPLLPGSNITVSDTSDYWICFISDYAAGIDAENSSRAVKVSTVKALHPAEQAYLTPLESVYGEWKAEFLRIWTRKEAYSKFCGRGLSIGMSGFSAVGPDGDLSPVIFKKNYPPALVMDVPGLSGLTVSLCIPADEQLPAELIWQQLEYDAPFNISALEKAAEFLDIRAYSSAEMEGRLTELGYPRDISRQAVETLKERGYIDDEAYARSLALRMAGSGKGKLRIQSELQKKGIDRARSSELMEDMENSGEGLSQREQARAQAARMFGEPHPLTEKEAGKLARKLFSLGYENSVIYGILEEYRK